MKIPDTYPDFLTEILAKNKPDTYPSIYPEKIVHLGDRAGYQTIFFGKN